MDNYRDIVLLILSTGLLSIGWFARQVWAAVQDLKGDLNTLKVEIGTNYVRYDRLKDIMEPIMDALTDIKATLKGKVDK
jgi:hypothetical protein